MADVEFSGGITNPEQTLEGTGDNWEFSGGITNPEQSLAGILDIPAEFSGGITNPEQSLGGIVELGEFSGGISNFVQALTGIISWPLVGGITNPVQELSGILDKFEAQGGITNATQNLSGEIRHYYPFSGGITNPVQHFYQMPEIIELTIVPENAVGFVNGEYTDIFRAGPEFLLVMDPWWFETEEDQSNLWVAGGVQIVEVTIPKEVITEIPVMPDDGRIYGLLNGAWVDITDSLINPPL